VQKTAVSEELKRIMESVDLLRKNTGATDQMSQTDNLLDELALLLHELRDVNENALSLLSEVEQQGKRLASDIEDTAARITVHHEFMKKIERATADLGSIAATSKKLLSGNGKSLEPGMLRHLEKNYTMHSERHIHRSFAQPNGGPNQPLPLPVIKPAAKTDDGFGDNVELF
jgi:ABC-type transporter Mla subunit MlaD